MIFKRKNFKRITKNNFITLITVAIVFVSNIVTATEGVFLDGTAQVYPISNTVTVFKDSSGLVSCNDILNSAEAFHFKPVKKSIPNEGFSDAVYWFKADLKENSPIGRDWIFDIAMPSLHDVSFYIISEHTLLDSVKTGFSAGKKEKRFNYRNPAIEFHSTPGTSYTIYTRIKSATPVIAPFFLRERRWYIEYDRTRDAMLGLYFGAVIIMALYHFYMYLSIKDRGYLWLSAFSILFIVGQMTAVYGYLSDWGIEKPGAFINLLHIINYVATFAAMLLSRSFINSVKYTPWADKVLYSIQIISITLAPLSIFLSFATAEQILLLFNLIPLPFLLYSAGVAFSKGYRAGLYYILANTCFIVGLAIYNCMYGFGLLPFNMFIYFIPNITFVIMLSLYSLGLADKIATYRKEHEKAQLQACRDLEVKLRLQEEKLLIERELEQSRKMELAGRLLSGVAHDIKNYLNPILGYSSIIGKHCRDNEMLSNHSKHLSNAANQLKNLTSSLLDVTRKKQEISTFDITHLIEQITSILKHSSQKSIVFKNIKTADKLEIIGDRSLIQNAIINIGLNAVDAIEGNGAITLSTGTMRLDKTHPARRKFDVPEGVYIYISIEDTGTGMAQEVMNHLFEPFFSKKKNGTGNGLGLVNVYNCVTLHNGCIGVESTPGIGTTFTVFLPIERTTLNTEQSTFCSVVDSVAIEQH